MTDGKGEREEGARPDNLGRQVVRGLVWTYAGYVVQFLAQTIGMIVLARYLLPEDFGLFAVGMMIVGVGTTLSAMGLGPALVQKRGAVDGYFDIVFSANAMIAVFSASTLYAIMPWVAGTFFEMPEAVDPVRVLVLSVAIVGFNNPGNINLVRKIDARRLLLIAVARPLVRYPLSIGLAVTGHGAWALVLGFVGGEIGVLIASYVINPYLPWFRIDGAKFREMYAFAGWLHIKNVMKWAARHADTIMVAKLLGAVDLGFYNRGLTLATIPQHQMTVVINSVAFPMFSAVQSDLPAARRFLKRTFDLAALTYFPVAVVVLSNSEAVVAVVLGEPWVSLAPVFEVLVVAVGFRGLLEAFVPLIRGGGHARAEFWLLTLQVVASATVLYPFVLLWGTTGAALSILTGSLVALPVALLVARRVAEVGFRDWAGAPVVSSIAAAAVILPTRLLTSGVDGRWPQLCFVAGALLVFGVLIALADALFGVGPFGSVKAAFQRLLKRQ